MGRGPVADGLHRISDWRRVLRLHTSMPRVEHARLRFVWEVNSSLEQPTMSYVSGFVVLALSLICTACCASDTAVLIID